ncbi:hypothetical protein GGI04_000167 [Coemansia thaxteri]|nr:hypothetical protein GGI04_000167 [Coemansia thaxteri]KAJ2474394.1 hypothetical protein GGI02_000104 [Coemansia sp. RSA 2322]
MAGGIGPQIPPEVAAMLGISVGQQSGDSSPADPTDVATEVIGPAMPPPGVLPSRQLNRSPSPSNATDAESDDDLVGPSVSLASYTAEQALRQKIDLVEARASRSGETEGTGSDTDGKREEWMLVPPSAESSKTVRGSRGGGGPQGRNIATAPLFDKSWTETPEEKRQRKDKERNSTRREAPVEEETPDMRRKREENDEKSKWVDEFNRSQRPKSLLELHLESKNKDKRDRRDKGRRRDRERSPSSRQGNRHGAHGDNSDGDGEDDEWKRERFDRSRDLSSGKVDSRRQREMLNTMGFLSDKYAPGKGGSFM